MTRRRRFLDGIGFGYLHMVLVTLVGLWLTPFLLTHVGQRDLGLWMLATQILSYIALFDIGVAALLPREVAYVTGRTGDSGSTELVTLLGRVRRITRWQVPLVACAAVLAWWAMPASWTGLRGPLALVLAAYVILFPVRLYQSLLQGLQDLRFLGQIQLAGWAATTALTVVLVATGWGLWALVAGAAALQLATAAACAVRVCRRHPTLWRASAEETSWPAVRRYLEQSGWVSVAQIAQLLMNGTDILVIGAFLGPAAVVPYSCTAKLVSVLGNHPQLLMQSASPILSELRASGNAARLREVSLALARGMLLLSGAVACTVIVANRGFVSWWVGPTQFGGGTLTILLVANMALRHWNTTVVYSLFCFGFERRLSLTTMADGLVSVILAAVFVPMMGPVGAPLGSIVAVLCVSLPMNLRGLGAGLEASPWHLLAAQGSFAARFVPLAAAAAAFSLWVPGAWQGVALGTAVVGVVYGVVMVPLAFQPPLGEYVRWWLAQVGLGAKAAQPQVP